MVVGQSEGAGNPVGQASVPVSSALHVYRRKLPHWRMGGATYFVTWRLSKGQVELAPEERTLVVDALRHFDRQRYELWTSVVMNDHVHALVTPWEPHPLQAIVHSWKSFTANRLQRIGRRRGKIWQDESLDRIVRDEAELLEKWRYILQNPRKRWPGVSDYPWVTGTEACPTVDAPQRPGP